MAKSNGTDGPDLSVRLGTAKAATTGTPVLALLFIRPSSGLLAARQNQDLVDRAGAQHERWLMGLPCGRPGRCRCRRFFSKTIRIFGWDLPGPQQPWSGGIYLHPWHNMFICAAHSESDVRQTLAATDEAFDEVKKRRGRLEPDAGLMNLLRARANGV